MRKSTWTFIFAVFCCTFLSEQEINAQQIADTFYLKSNGGWDYILADSASDNLYISHGTQVNVINKNTGDSIGVIPNANGVHGIALVHNLNKGFTSNGRLNNVFVFDLNTLQITDSIATGKNPDAIFYDDYSKMIITCNGGSENINVIDPATDKVVSTINVKGKPETAVSDGEGKIYINNEDKSEIEVVDINTKKLIHSWSIAPGKAPSGLSIDRKNKLLFAGCENKYLMVIDATSGKVINKLPIGDGCDGIAFDATINTIYSSNGEGTLTIVKELSKNKFDSIKNLSTKRGARTLSVDPSTHNIYLPAANFGEAKTKEEWPPVILGSFQILVAKIF